MKEVAGSTEPAAPRRTVLGRWYARLDLTGKITFALLTGALMICGIMALASFWFSRQLLLTNTHSLLTARAEQHSRAIELKLASALALAEGLAINTVTANALADSFGRGHYLVPMLRNQRLPFTEVRILLTDYRGRAIASNDDGPMVNLEQNPAFLGMLRQQGSYAVITGEPGVDVAITAAFPVVYLLTGNIEGSIVVRIPLFPLLASGLPGETFHLENAAGDWLAGTKPVEPVLQVRDQLHLGATMEPLGLALVLSMDRNKALHQLDLMVGLYLVFGLLLSAVVVVLARSSAHYLSAPLQRVVDAAEQLAASGRLRVRLPVHTDDAFGRLVTAFNVMVERLQDSYDALESRVAERTQALSASETRLRYVMDATGEGMWDWDITRNRVTHNNQWRELLGLGSEFNEHSSEDYLRLIHEEDRTRVRAAIRQCLEAHKPYRAEYRMQTRGATELWVLDRGDVVERDPYGRPLRMVGSLADISERKRATEALRVRELYLRATLDNLPFLFWLKDAECRFLAVNKVFADACGQGDPDAMAGMTDWDVWPPDLAKSYHADDLDVMESRKEKTVEEPVQDKGYRGWIETYKKPVVSDDGRILGTVGFARDITDRKRMEQALKESEERWGLAVTGANDGIWDWNLVTNDIFFSERWKTMLGYSEEELPNRLEEWSSRVHPEDYEPVMQALRRHLDGLTEDYQSEFRLRCKDGQYKWILTRGRAMRDADGRAVRISGSHSDISERRATALRLQDRTEQLNTILLLSPDGFVSFDAGHCVKYVSPAFYQLTGLNEGDIGGLTETEFDALLLKRCDPAAPFMGIRALRGHELQAKGAINRHLIELSTPQRVLEAGLRLGAGESVSQILYFRDVTFETEVDRMKSEFLSTAAHELRTPMANIYGFSELLLNQEFDEDTRQDILTTIYKQSELMASIINELLDLARIEARRGKDFVIERLELPELLTEVINGFNPPEGREAPCFDPEGKVLQVRADRKKLVQAFNNILSNAYKYSPEGGEVRVRLLDAGDGARGGESGVEIADQGIGMSPRQLARVCERFYRADTSGKIPGTGLGMSIVQEVIGLHHGRLEIDSQLGQGTQVRVWLPLPEAAG